MAFTVDDPSGGTGHIPTRHPSIQTAGELLRSRSREEHGLGARDRDFTAAGRPRRQQAPEEQSMMDLMARQVALLQEQTLLLRQQSASQTIGEDEYIDPSRILSSLDPTLRTTMSKWKSDFCKDLNHVATQRELHDKYEKIRESGEIMKQFAEESNRKWQWPKAYEAIAEPITPLEDVPNGDDEVYDINQAWAALRRKHALECQDFIMQHQSRALAYFENKTGNSSVQQTVDDLWNSWKDSFGSLHSEASLQRASKNCKYFVNVVMREEIPKMKGRLHEAAELRSKREAAIIEAETKYQQMDPQQLIALLQLDKQAVQIRKGGNLTKQVTVTKGSELAALVTQFPDLETFFDVKHVDPSSSSTAPPKLLSARTRIPTPHPSRSARRPKSQTSLRGRSHGKSPRSSSRRPSKGKGKSRNDGCVGKGKGKGKGKKGKGRAASRKRVSWGHAS